MDRITFAQLNEAYHKGVYGQEETLDIQEWVEALIEEGYDLDEYTDDELYEAYLADLEEARVDDTVKDKEKKRNERHGSVTHYFPDNQAKQTDARRSDHRKQRGVTKVQAGLPASGMSGETHLLNYKNRFNEPRPEDKKRVGPQEGSGQYERMASGMKNIPPEERSRIISKIKKGITKKPRVPLPEELDLYDLVSEYLVSEGFCDSYEDADVIMANMSEEWRDGILDEVTGGGFISQSGTTYNSDHLSPAQQRRDKFKQIYGRDTGAKTVDQARGEAGIRSRYSRGSREEVPNRSGYGTARSPGGSDSGLSMSPAKRAELAAKRAERGGDSKRANKIRSIMSRPPVSEDIDLYDLVSEYLVSEGFCDSYEDADVIMANMSEEWREGIVEEILEEFKPTGYSMGYHSPVTGRGKKARQIDSQIEKLKMSGKRGQAQAVDFVNRMQDTLEGRSEVMATSRRNKSKLGARARRDAQRDSSG